MFRELIKLLSKDNLQVQALGECYEMLDLCEQMLDKSITSLRRRDDASLGEELYKADKQLNSFERDVRRKVMTHLALGNPGDLTAGLTLVSIVIDLERIGDYTKNISDLAANHPARLEGGEIEKDVAEIELASLEIFRRAARAFKVGDIKESRALMQEYKDDVSLRYRRLEARLVRGEVDLPVGDAVCLALYVRFLKRISAHSRNLISSIVNPFDRIGYEE